MNAGVGHEAWERYDEEVRRLLPRNFPANVWEGGLYMVGAAFVAGETVLPAMVEALGGPSWLIALCPVLLVLGFSLPPLWMAPIVERLERMKPLVVWLTLLQRLPFLVAGLVLVIWGETHPALGLVFVVVAPLLSGFGTGMCVTAWFEMFCRCIPSERMAAAWAGRWFIHGVGGLLAGLVIRVVLDYDSGPRGFGILFLLAFAFLMLSYGVLLMVKEVVPPMDVEERRRVLGVGAVLGRWRGIWMGDRLFRRFVYARSLAFAYLLPAPFLGLEALSTTGRSEGFLGYLVAIQMAGGIVANGLLYRYGDRVGSRMVLLASKGSLLAMCLLLVGATGVSVWTLVFFLYGFSFAAQQVGFSTMMAQLSPPGQRSAWMGIVSVLMLPCLLLAAGLSGWLMEVGGGMLTLAFLAFGIQLVGLMIVWRMPQRGRAG